jgi:hypothetical protein
MSIIDLDAFEPQAALAILLEHGVFRVPGFVGADALTELRKEFESAFEDGQEGVRRIDYSLGRGAVVQPEQVAKHVFPTLREVFLDPQFAALAEGFFPGEFTLNRDVFVVEDVVGSRHYANDLHYDVLRTLKFYVYLNDVDERNGAFTCVPGSHLETEKLRRQHGDKVTLENRQVTRQLPLDHFPAPEPVCGEAGALIVFDTDIWHQAGTMQSGHRLVMRGHTRLFSPPTRTGNVPPTVQPADEQRGLLARLRRMFA